jgi:hypothetical protein
MKILCHVPDGLPRPIPQGMRAFSLFSTAGEAGVGTIARGWVRELENAGHAPPPAEWDFTVLCFAVCAADLASPRRASPDGWTRQIDLTVALHDPTPWTAQQGRIEAMLRVLTGDFWTLSFQSGGRSPPRGERVLCDRDCVVLLSGGLDSLVGGIDVTSSGRRPIFVSQLAHEDSERQRTYARALGGVNWHQQWSHGIDFSGDHEPSTRARSLAFYGLAVLASTLLPTGNPEIVVPENGFISVNPPLLPGRMGSLSTRTTHPLFMRMLGEILARAGIGATLSMPYRFKTKGEMLTDCLDQNMLLSLASDTTSCGRFRTYNRTHCGRCIPCMVRKAAFLRWGTVPDATRYKFGSLAGADKSGADDPMAVACAVRHRDSKGIDAFLGSALSFAGATELARYTRVIDAGLEELKVLLRRDGIL